MTGNLRALLYLTVVTIFTPFFYRTLYEPDYFWHVAVGKQLISGEGMGEGLLGTWGIADQDWRSTQPLAEIVMHFVHSRGGLTLVAILRLSFWIFLAVWLYLNLIAGMLDSLRNHIKYLLIVLACVITLFSASLVQERPQTISLLFLILLSKRLIKLGLQDVTKPDFLLVTLIGLWTLFHPMWIVAYLIILLATGCRWRELTTAKFKDRLLWIVSLALIPLIPIFGPSGERYYLHLYAISSRGRRYISEWQPIWEVPGLSTPIILGSFLLIFLCFYVIAHQVHDYGKWQRFFLLLSIIFIFALFISAARNLSVALVLCVAIIGVQLESRAALDLQLEAARERDYWDLKSSPVPVRLFLIFIPIVALITSLSQASRATQDLEASMPLKIFRALSESDSKIFIFNSPNDAGFVRYFSGESAVPILDGRIDRYDPDLQYQVNKFLSEGVMSPGTFSFIVGKATGFFLRDDSPAVRALARQGWRVKWRDKGYLWISRNS